MENELKKRIGALLVMGILLAMIWASVPVTAPGSDGDWNIDGENLEMGYSGADSEGDVGIGTSSPSSKLEVDGDVELTNLYDNDGSNFFDGGAAASETVTGISSTGALQTASISISESQVTGEIESVTAGSGLTGGGTSGDVTLDIGAGDGINVYSGSIAVDVTDILGSGLRESSNNIGVYGLMAVDGSHVNTVYVDADGEVGMGTTTPAAGVDIRNTPYDFATNYGGGLGRTRLGVNIEQTLTAGAHGDALTAVYIHPTFDSGPYVDVEHYGLIVQSGKVGIGTAFPTVTLEVNGTVKADSFIGIYSPTDDIDMNNKLITNIGHADTDFTAGGGLNLAGNLGINTTDPQYALEVHAEMVWFNCSVIKFGNTSFNEAPWKDSLMSSGNYRIMFDDKDDPTDYYFAVGVHEDFPKHTPPYDTTERFWIRENGSTGVGAKHVLGRLWVHSTPYCGSGNITSSGTTVTGDGTSFTTELMVGSEIWVDIYHDPYQKPSDWQKQIRRVDAINSDTSLVINSPFSPELTNWSNYNYTVPILAVETTERVGIGTVSPTEKLDVNGGARIRELPQDNSLENFVVADANGVLHKRDGSTVGSLQDLWETIESVDDSTSTTADSPTDTLYFDGYGLATITIDGDTVNITVDEDAGKQNLLEVYEWEGSTGNDVMLSAGTGGDIRFYNAGSEMFFLDESSDRIGIGTITPTQKLHVNGSIRVEGAYYDSTNTPGTNGQVLSSTATGTLWINASWANATDELQNLAEVYEHDGPIGNDVELSASTGDDIRFYNDDAKEMLFLNESNGYIGIGTIGPMAKLHVDGGGVLATGTTGSTPVSGAGTRLMWIPAKAAFRAGAVIGSEWDNANIGDWSVAMGWKTTASGHGSTAMGINTTASGDISTAMGYGTVASEIYSFAVGNEAVASGHTSIAMGDSVTASGAGSVALGGSTTASGANSVALGRRTEASSGSAFASGVDTTASGWNSTAMGTSTTASGICSTAMGSWTTASDYYTTAMGYKTTASRDYATAMGTSITADGWYSFGIGLNIDATPPVISQANTMAIMGGKVGIDTIGPTEKLDVDGKARIRDLPLNNDLDDFVVADSTGVLHLRNGSTVGGAAEDDDWYEVGTTSPPDDIEDSIYTNGSVGIGIVNPGEKLDVDGNVHASGSFISGSTVTYGNGFITMSSGTNLNIDSDTLFVENSDNEVGIGTAGPGAKLHIIQSSAYTAFKVDDSVADATPFLIDDDGNVGIGTAGPDAKLEVSVSSGGAALFGMSNTATGNHAVAMGYTSSASGEDSVAMGDHASASGEDSIAMGTYTTASGDYSIAMGKDNTASGESSTAFGIDSTASAYGSTAMGCDMTISSSGTYSFGIGLDATGYTVTQSNVMAIMGGKVGIGTTHPDRALEVVNNQAQLRLTHTEGSVYTDFTVDSSNHLTIKPEGTGQIKLKADSNSQGFFQVIPSDTSAPVLNVDTSAREVGIWTDSPTGKLDVNGDDIRIRSSQTPSSSSASGNTGEIAWGNSGGTYYIYVCVSTDTWQRVALSSW